MQRNQRSDPARELANGVLSFVSHRLIEAQEIVGQWMLSEKNVDRKLGVGTTDSCRWSFHQLGHVVVALTMGGLEPIECMTGAIRLSKASSCNPLSTGREKWIEERTELEKRLAQLMGGRAAEALFFDDVSTLSSEDLREATEVARAMVMRYGMSASLGLVSFVTPADRVFRGHSDGTARMIDHEIQHLLDRAFSKACEKLEFARPFLEKTVERLQRRGSVNPDQLRLWWREFDGQASKASAEAPQGPSTPNASDKVIDTVIMH
jgi:cell division protease FtsH